MSSAEFRRAADAATRMIIASIGTPMPYLGSPPQVPPDSRVPLDSVAHVRAALHLMQRLPHDQWPRILGAAAGYGLISNTRAHELLTMSQDPVQWWCKTCSCSVPITCPDCGADACAKCWRCVTPGCGEYVVLPEGRKITFKPSSVRFQWRTSQPQAQRPGHGGTGRLP